MSQHNLEKIILKNSDHFTELKVTFMEIEMLANQRENNQTSIIKFT